MLEELRVLIELQGVDKKILDLKKEKQKMPAMIERAGAALRAVQADAAGAKAALDAVSKKKNDTDLNLKEENERLQKLKLRTTDIKTNKEYTAHLKEIEDCEKKISGLEDAAIETMEEIEKAKTACSAKEALVPEEKQRYEAGKSRIEKSFEEGESMLGQLRKRRGELIPKLSKTVIEDYSAMLETYPGSAVVKAVDGSCTGCMMMIPPQAFNNVRKGEAIIKCDHCHRILYYNEAH